MIQKILALISARNKEFFRDRASLAWNMLFPLLVVFGFAFAFSGKPREIFKVAVVASASLPASIQENFLKTEFVQFVATGSIDESLSKLSRHQFDLVLAGGSPSKYWINSTSPKGYLIERVLKGSLPTDSAPLLEKQSVVGHEIRYVDWLVAGLLGMNMMFSALFGVGYSIVRYRKNGVLKRLKATPISSFEFLFSQVLSRLVVICTVTSTVFIGSNLFLHFTMLGSYFTLFSILMMGALCLISMGLLVATSAKSEEFAGGLLQMLSWPMMFLSGVWFSLEGANPWLQKVAQIFPLTHVIDSARAVMTEGATLSAVAPHLAILAGMTVVFLSIGSYLFRWE